MHLLQLGNTYLSTYTKKILQKSIQMKKEADFEVSTVNNFNIHVHILLLKYIGIYIYIKKYHRSNKSNAA